MNLMFWKKQSGGEAESFDTDETGSDAPAKQGLGARIKLRLGGLAQHFRKPPAFRAGEDHAPDTQGSPETDQEPSFTETPAKPVLSMRFKLLIIAMVRRFRKTPASAAGDDREPDEQPGNALDAEPVRSRKWLILGGSIGLLALLSVGIWAIWPAPPPLKTVGEPGMIRLPFLPAPPSRSLPP